MIAFTKMHGLGNDFVVIDATQTPFALSAAQIQQLANRRLGVGFDQMLVLEKPKKNQCDFHLRIFNADGSEVGQCGNGARCIAQFIHANQLSPKTTLSVSTITEQLSLTLRSDGEVSVQMGVPQFAPRAVPFIADKEQLLYQVEASGNKVELSVVNVGNPHAVIRVEQIDCAMVANLGAELSKHPRFPQAVNVGFMQVLDPQHVRLQVYERGTGETLACGSGACAAMAIGRRNGWLNERVSVNQPGGNLQIDWAGPTQQIIMTGPAARVFCGELKI